MVDAVKPQNDHGYGPNWTLFDPLFEKYAQSSGVPIEWLKTICMIESSLGTDPLVARGLKDPSDVIGSASQDGKSWGIMQLTLGAARDFDIIASCPKLNDPDYSVRIASLLLKRLSRQFTGEEEWVIKSYNQGAGSSILEKHGKIIGNSGEYWQKYLDHKELLSD